MIALFSLLIYFEKCVCLTLFPVVLNRDLSNGTGDTNLNECQFYIHRLPTTIKKEVAYQEIN